MLPDYLQTRLDRKALRQWRGLSILIMIGWLVYAVYITLNFISNSTWFRCIEILVFWALLIMYMRVLHKGDRVLFVILRYCVLAWVLLTLLFYLIGSEKTIWRVIGVWGEGIWMLSALFYVYLSFLSWESQQYELEQHRRSDNPYIPPFNPELISAREWESLHEDWS